MTWEGREVTVWAVEEDMSRLATFVTESLLL
jgi:hypothetical protein